MVVKVATLEVTVGGVELPGLFPQFSRGSLPRHEVDRCQGLDQFPSGKFLAHDLDPRPSLSSVDRRCY